MGRNPSETTVAVEALMEARADFLRMQDVARWLFQTAREGAAKAKEATGKVEHKEEKCQTNGSRLRN